MINVKIHQKLHDQEIMDWLEQECGEEAVTAFGECLPDPTVYTPEEMVSICNKVLEKYNSALRIVKFRGKDDDGYFWDTEESRLLYPTYKG
jgi:hypothetical protein